MIDYDDAGRPVAHVGNPGPTHLPLSEPTRRYGAAEIHTFMASVA
ncbi:hypothetical protein [Streptomyces sp. NPDC020996]